MHPPVPFDHIFTRHVDAVHTQHDLGPAVDVGGAEGQVDRVVPDKDLGMDSRRPSGDLADAVLQTIDGNPVEPAFERIFAIQIVSARKLAAFDLASHHNIEPRQSHFTGEAVQSQLFRLLSAGT